MNSSEVISTRTAVGAGIGGVVGFAFGGPVGAGVGGLIGGAIAHASGDEAATKGVMTPKRRIIFLRAMEKVGDPEELKKLADAFAGEGLSGEAAMLRKRAELRTLSPEVQERRRAAFRKAMASDNPDAIVGIAKAFEAAGSIDAAKTLRDHADAVRAAHTAGKSAKPMTGGTLAQFADKLGKALINFGPTSPHARAAARNLIQARGKTPSEEIITEVIRIASESLKIEVKPAAAPTDDVAAPAEAAEAEATAEEAEVAAPPAPPAPAEAAPAQAAAPPAAPEPSPTGAAEPTVMGPLASRVEPPAIASNVAGEMAEEAPQAKIATVSPEGISDIVETEGASGLG